MEQKNELKAILFRLKHQRGLTMKQVADDLGMNYSYLSDVNSGRSPFTEATRAKFIQMYGKHIIEPDSTEATLLKVYDGGENLEASTYVPLLPISAQGGSLNDFVVSVKDSDCERVISPIKGTDFAMTVAGDSMAPEYPSGSQILIKKINERAFIDWGKVYVLDTCNGSVIKRIFPADDKDPRKVKCVSINPDYPAFEVSFADIYGIYRVLLSMSVK